LVPLDYNYYKTINLPWFAPPTAFYGIVWTVTYILISISITCLLYSYRFKELPVSYKISLIVNYLFNQSYVLVFFGLKSNFLGFVSCLGTFISSMFLFYDTNILKDKCSKYLIFYIILALFASILSFTIYIINL